MTDALSSSLAAKLLSRPVAPTGSHEVSTIPFVVMVLSVLLLATSFVRRALEKSAGRRPKWARRSSSALAALRSHLPEAAEASPAKEEKQRQKKKVSRRRQARAPHGAAPAAAERIASELEEQPPAAEPASEDAPEAGPEASAEEAAPARAEAAPEPVPGAPAVAEEAREEEVAEATVDAPPAVEGEVAAPSAEPCRGAATSWGCEDDKIYSPALLLAHRELHLRVMRGPPGLPAPKARPPFPAQSASLKAQAPPAEKTPPRAPAPAAFLTMGELEAMEAPTRRGKFVVAEADVTIHVNADQNRYQVYRDGKELRSLAWGGPQWPRLGAAWARVQEVAAESGGRQRSRSTDMDYP